MNWPQDKRFIADVCKHFPSGVPAGRELAHLAECDARILVCGEAGGKDENKLGRPFVGAAGRVLDKILTEVGLTRADIYLTNVVPYQPPHGNEFYSIPPAVVAQGKEALWDKIHASEISAIVPLGNHALHAISGHAGIMKWRGSVMPIHERWYVPSIHPAAMLRSPALLKTAFYDWHRIKEIANNGWKYPVYELVVTQWGDPRIATLVNAKVLSVDIETVRGTSKVLCISFCADGRTSYSVDCRQGIPEIVRALLESHTPKIFQNGLFDTYILRLNGIRTARFIYDTCLMFHALDNNAGPVTSASANRGASIIKPYSLAYMASVFTPFPYWKDSGKDEGKGENEQKYKRNWQEFSEYNAMDSLGTYWIARELKRRLIASGRWEFYKTQYAAILYPILDLSLRGVRFDTERAKAATESLGRQIIDARGRCEGLAGRPLRAFKVFKKEPKVKEGRKDGLVISRRLIPGGDGDGSGGVESWVGEKKSISNTILQRYLYDTLKLPRQTKDNHTTSDEVAIRNLQLIVKEGGNGRKRWKGDKAKTESFLQAILDFRELEKTIQFLASGAVDNDGRIRAAYGLNVQTGRLRSSGNPSGTGYNLQNIARHIRHFFLPDDLDGNPSENGNGDASKETTYFLELDLKQAEDLVVKTISGAITGDNRPLQLVQAVQSGTKDIHRALAAVVFGVRPEAVTYAQRYATKRCRHGINNGMGTKRMQQSLLKDGFVFTLQEIKEMFRVINAAEPWVSDFHQGCRRAVMRRAGVATSWGWQLILDSRFERLSEPRTFNRSYTFIEQSEVGVLLKQYGLLTYWNKIRPSFRARLNMLVHDNVVLSVPRSELYDVLSIIYNALTQPRRYGIYHPSGCMCGECDSVETRELSIPAEAKISKTLSCSCDDCKKAQQPLELADLPSREDFERRLQEWEMTN